MGFVAPNLITTLDSVTYASQLNQNLKDIQSAFNRLQTQLSLSGSIPTNPLAGLGTMDHVAMMGRYGGVIGNDSFTISFPDDDTAGNKVDAIISHTDIVTGTSYAIFGDLTNPLNSFTRFYRNQSRTTLSMTTATAGLPDGTYNICIGAKSEGAPNMSYVMLQCASTLDDTDYASSGIALPLYTFDYVIASSTYTVKNLRRASTVLVAQDSFQKTYETEHPISILLDDPLPSHSAAGGSYADSMNTEGYMATVGGLIVPWDCEVTRAYVNVDTVGSATVTAGTDGWAFTLYEGNYPGLLGAGHAGGHGMEQVVDGPTYLVSDSTTSVIDGFAQPKQLAAGTFIQPALGLFDDPDRALGTDAEPPTGMTITVVVRRHYEGIYA